MLHQILIGRHRETRKRAHPMMHDACRDDRTKLAKIGSKEIDES